MAHVRTAQMKPRARTMAIQGLPSNRVLMPLNAASSFAINGAAMHLVVLSNRRLPECARTGPGRAAKPHTLTAAFGFLGLLRLCSLLQRQSDIASEQDVGANGLLQDLEGEFRLDSGGDEQFTQFESRACGLVGSADGCDHVLSSNLGHGEVVLELGHGEASQVRDVVLVGQDRELYVECHGFSSEDIVEGVHVIDHSLDAVHAIVGEVDAALVCLLRSPYQYTHYHAG